MHVLKAIVLASDQLYSVAGLHDQLQREGLAWAVETHNTPELYEWLLTVLSFQGVSDSAARTYMREHGTPSWEQMESLLAESS
jgi:hypothetical protein